MSYPYKPLPKEELEEFVQELYHPEEHFPLNFVTAEKGLALCPCMMQDAADQILKLQKVIEEKDAN